MISHAASILLGQMAGGDCFISECSGAFLRVPETLLRGDSKIAGLWQVDPQSCTMFQDDD